MHGKLYTGNKMTKFKYIMMHINKKAQPVFRLLAFSVLAASMLPIIYFILAYINSGVFDLSIILYSAFTMAACLIVAILSLIFDELSP